MQSTVLNGLWATPTHRWYLTLAAVCSVLLLFTCLSRVKALGAAPLGSSIVRYVTEDGRGNVDGSSWMNASNDLQAMINASDVTEVWVAGGLYIPSVTSLSTLRTASFKMKNNVAIYGGFVGNETRRDARPAVNPVMGTPSSTTLSGNTGSIFNTSDKSYHVINNTSNSLDNTAVLDGFVITGGKASGGTDVGGDYTIPGSKYGGGIYNNNSSPTITNCSLLSNSAVSGGGIFNASSSSPRLTNCSLQGNSAIADANSAMTGDGGGIYNTSSSNPVLINCRLQNNSAAFRGGGIYNVNSSPTLTNCSLLGNSAPGGGGLFNENGSPRLTNCSLLSNSAINGGGIYNVTDSNPKLTNCVLWDNGGNKTIFYEPSTFETSTSTLATFSLFDNTVTGYNTGGTGNKTTTSSPFASANSVALAPGSPAIDAGSNAAYLTADGPDTDLAGNPRFLPQDGTIDMGAVESPVAPANTAPMATSNANQTATVGTAFSYTVNTFTDAETPNSLTYTASINPTNGFSFNPTTRVISSTPANTGTSSITITATDPGSLSASTSFTITVGPAMVVVPPAGPFSITGVTTVSCQTESAGLRTLTFNPRYAGTTGQPISFSVVNEMLPTTNPGPYTLKLYTDNPTITLKAVQQGTAGEASFKYDWLAACNTGTNPPPNQAPTTTGIPNQNATVGQPFSLNVAPFFSDPNGDALGFAASGLPTGLNLNGSTISGIPGSSGVSSVTLTATDPGNLSAKAIFELTVNPAAGGNPPTTAPFAITGVTTVSCQAVSAGLRQLRFNPQYGGTNGQPISFSVVNEMLPTTSPGPYTLNLYTDNPVITLKAVQQGTAGEASFTYNWLAACNTGSNKRIGVAEPLSRFSLEVLGNPAHEQLRIRISGAEGQAVRLRLTDLRGRELESRLVEPAGAANEQRFNLRQTPAGMLVLQAVSQGQTQVVKILHQ